MPSTFTSLAHDVLPVLVEDAARVDVGAIFPDRGVEALRASGLFGLMVPAADGGLGGDVRDLIEVAAVLATGCSSTAMIWGMHCQQVDAVVRHGSPRLRAELLPRIVGEGYYLASVTTESSKGGGLLTAESALVGATDATLQVLREAPIVTGGERADGFLITARSSPDAPSNSVSLVHLDRSQARVEVTGAWDAMGMRGTRSVALVLEGTIGSHQVIGGPGRFREVAVDSIIPVGHVVWSACWLGAARGALDGVVARVRSAKPGQRLAADDDIVLDRLAKVRIKLELVSAILWRVADELGQRRRDGITTDDRNFQVRLDALKVSSSELTFAAVDELVELGGAGIGYQRGSPVPLERVFRDLRSASLNNANDRLLRTIGGYTALTGSGPLRNPSG